MLACHVCDTENDHVLQRGAPLVELVHLPVAPRDFAYYTSLFSGKGVVLDVAQLAADPAAPLDRKVRIYSAAARMTATDRARFTDIIAAVQPEQAGPATPREQGENAREKREGERAYNTPQPHEGHGAARPVQVMAEARPKNVRALSVLPSAVQEGERLSPPAGRSRMVPAILRQRRLDAARKALARYPDVSARDLARAIAIATRHPCSESTAYKLRTELTARPRLQAVDASDISDGTSDIEGMPEA